MDRFLSRHVWNRAPRIPEWRDETRAHKYEVCSQSSLEIQQLLDCLVLWLYASLQRFYCRICQFRSLIDQLYDYRYHNELPSTCCHSRI